MEIENILSYIGSLGLGAVIGASVIYLFVKSFLPSYFSEKGKNLAKKEDIEAITDKVESIKNDYTKVLEELRNNNKLRLAEIDREKSIKREVYLEAVESITRSHSVISSLSNLDIDVQKISSEMIFDDGKVAKIHIVGSEETVKAITDFMASIGTATLELLLERSKLVERKNTITLLNEYREKSAEEINRYITMMKNINLEGITDQRLWNTVNDGIEFEKEQRDKYAKEIEEHWEIQNKNHLEFTKKSMTRYFEASELLPEAVLSIRKELDLKISEEGYRKIFKNHDDKGKKYLKIL